LEKIRLSSTEHLTEPSDFLETAYLILFGELSTAVQHSAWTRQIYTGAAPREYVARDNRG